MKKKLLFFLILTAILIIFASCGETPDENRGIVTVNGSGDRLTCTFSPDATLLDRYGRTDLYLFALPAGDSGSDLSGRNYIAKTRASKTVTYKINTVENGENRLYSGFTVAFLDGGKYIPAIDAPAFVGNPEILSKDNSAYPTAASMKGLVPDDATDAIALGVSHAVIRLPLEKYISVSGGGESFDFSGYKFYINEENLAKLDEEIEIYRRENVLVYLEFTLTASAEELGADMAFLAFPETKAGAVGYLPDLRNDRCAAAVAGFADFIAARYPSVFAFIAGRGANGFYKNANVGGESGEFLRVYTAFARTLDTALRAHRKNGKLFVATDNCYKVSSGGMSSSAFLEKLLKTVKSGGEFPFGVALSLRATSTDPDRVWFDDSGSGNYITPSNIGKFMTSLLDTDAFLYNGEKRNVIVSDFSIKTTSDPSSETNQAASYYYAYCKAALTGRIDAFVYSSHKVDDGAALYKPDESGTSKRKIYDLVSTIDTDKAVPEEIKTALGAGAFNSLSSETEKIIKVFSYATGVAAPSAVENYDASKLNVSEMRAAGGTATVADDKISFNFKVSYSASKPFAAFDVKASKIKSDTLILRDLTLSQSAKVTLSMRGGGAVYESSIDLAANTPTTAVFDISEFSGKVKGGDVTVRISVSGDASEISASTSEIMTGKARSNLGLVIALAAILTVTVAAMAILSIRYIKKK